MNTTQIWDIFEIALNLNAETLAARNPWTEIDLSADFHHPSSGVQVTVSGFYDGVGICRIRFMSTREGAWEYITRSNTPELDALAGRLLCSAAQGNNRGPVRVHEGFHFAYANGERFLPFGTTCYAWTHQTEELQEQTLATLRDAPFNKVRMCIFPKDYIYNQNKPPHHLLARNEAGALLPAQPNPAAWRHFERRLADLRDLGIEADVILFHPYDRWGYDRMTPEDDLRYLRYATARLAAFRNVWWSMANEYDFMLDSKPMEHWHALFATLQEGDPYGHLASIHNGNPAKAYDHTLPWISHVSMQDSEIRQAQVWRERYGKPVVNDELQYEGDIPKQWGNISAQELVHRFWWMVANGCYASHGETFLHPDDVLWWAKGGVLRGESAPRLAFLRRILEEDVQVGLTPFGLREPWMSIAGGGEGAYRLIYFAEHQPALWFIGIMEDPDAVPEDFELDIIDPWEMTITPAETCPPPWQPTPRGVKPIQMSPFAVRLPVKPRIALRVRPR